MQEELDGWMEQVELMKTEFSEKEKSLTDEHRNALHKMALEHENETAELRFVFLERFTGRIRISGRQI